MRSSPTSLSAQNGRRLVTANALATPRLSAEKKPSELHTSSRRPISPMPPREVITESMTPATVPESSGVPACTWWMMNWRAVPWPTKKLSTTIPRTSSWKMERIAK